MAKQFCCALNKGDVNEEQKGEPVQTLLPVSEMTEGRLAARPLFIFHNSSSEWRWKPKDAAQPSFT